MTALTPTYAAVDVRASGGDLMVGRIRVSRSQALRLLEIWRSERTKACEADDRATWAAANALCGAMRRALLDADAHERAQRPPMTKVGAEIFQLFAGAGR